MSEKYHFIYLTTNLITGKKYIGEHSTVDIDDGYLGSGTYIKNSIGKYGKENFKRKILKFYDSKEAAFNNEKYWINEYETLKPFGYNQHPEGGFTYIENHSKKTKKLISEKTRKGLKKRGYVMTVEHRKKLSESKKGKKLSPEHAKKCGNAMRGKKHSSETLKKMSESGKGISKSADHKRKIGEAQMGEKNHMYGKPSWNKGKPMSEDQKEKLRKCNKGNSYRLGISHTEEAKKKMSDGHKGLIPWNIGKKLTPEHKKKLSESHMGKEAWNKGKTMSEEHRKKLSESKKGKNPFLNMPIGKCTYCGKEMKMSHLTRYHNHNCPKKDI